MSADSVQITVRGHGNLDGRHIHVGQSFSLDVFIPSKKFKYVQILTHKLSVRL